MADFVLVHGAWHGGWCYRDTANALRQAGHQVFTPTHTGVGEKAHLASESITLETHVRDIAGCLEAEELTDVIICGHSYGGMVITQLADRMADKIKAMVYLDAFVPEHGQSLNALLELALPAEVAQQFLDGFRGSAQEGGSGMMQPIPAEMFGILEKNRPWVERRCVPQSLATFEMPVLLSDTAPVAERVYILADSWDPSPFRYFAEKYSSDPGWTVTKMPSSHDVMVDMPKELADELMKLA
ncbi:alpha/beta hydrolase [Chromatiales bacterium (ex Bugula neritina AB1)]|nr:alpha/beta hydrolase [Chromatiales bacterium (ex Bugula neritina AB1)]